MSELISRTTLLNDKVWLCGGYVGDEYAKGYMDALDKVETVIKEQQTVEPVRGEWIPVSERLPAINGQYLCQIKGSLKNAYFDVFCFSDDLYSVDEYDFHKYRGKKKKSGFYDYDSEWGYFEVRGVAAWMPLPVPYKEEGAE